MLTHCMFLLKSFPAITLLPTMKILHEIHLHHHLHHYHHPYPSSSCPLVEEWSGSSEYSLPENILAGQCSQVSTINLQNGAVFKTHFLIHNSKLLHTLPSDSSQLPRNFSVNKLFFQSNSVFPSLGPWRRVRYLLHMFPQSQSGYPLYTIFNQTLMECMLYVVYSHSVGVIYREKLLSIQ